MPITSLAVTKRVQMAMTLRDFLSPTLMVFFEQQGFFRNVVCRVDGFILAAIVS